MCYQWNNTIEHYTFIAIGFQLHRKNAKNSFVIVFNDTLRKPKLMFRITPIATEMQSLARFGRTFI